MRNYLFLLAILCTLLGCQQSQRNEKSVDQLVQKVPVSSSAAVDSIKDPQRKFVRTADIKFKVKDVINATYDIENICTTHDGFVTFTNLTSNIDEHSETPVSTDSLLETTFYTVTNSIILRVPNTKLDTTLKDIAKNIDYLDYRIIKADDVGIQMLANDFSQTRATKNADRITKDIDNNNKKIEETVQAENEALSKQEQADNAKIANLTLNDQIKYSTVNLLIYQRQGVKRAIVLNDKNETKYKLGFGYRIMEALGFGWEMLAFILVSLSKLWGLFLLVVLGYVGYKWYGKRKK
jgi:Domain of unknown function (DUF4349)